MESSTRNSLGSAQPDAVEVLIVGGGIVGLSCAHYLLELGRQPAVVDQGEVGRGSSYGNAGLIAPSHSIPLPAPGVVRQGLRWLTNPESPFYVRPRLDPALARWLLRFAIAARRRPMSRGIPVLRDLNRLSAELYSELSSKATQPGLEYHSPGVVNVFQSKRAFEHGRHEAELLEQHGVPSQILVGDEVLSAEPALAEGMAGGVLWPEDGYIDPAAFVAGWRSELSQRGVRFLTGTEVLSVSQSGTKPQVRTTAGYLSCEDVVISAGAWSPRLLRGLGRLAVQPAKGYSVTIREPAAQLSLPLLLVEAKVAATPMGGSLRLAGTMELAGLDQTVDLRRLEAVRRSAEPFLHAGVTGSEELIWRGLRPLSADGLPMIGRLSRAPRIAVATGHGHIGVSLAPATGRVIAELLCERTPSVDLTQLRPDR